MNNPNKNTLTSNYSYEIETYSLIHNVNESILLTNQFIGNYGYEFVKINFTELQKKFSKLFSSQKSFSNDTLTISENSGIVLSGIFYKSLSESDLINPEILINEKLFLLKRTTNYKMNVIDNQISFREMLIIKAEHIEFTNSVIQQFRLFKAGNISSPITFQISQKNREIHSTLKSNIIGSHNVFDINSKEIIILSKKFIPKFKKTELTEIALENFNLSYVILDKKTQYLTLMTSLESLFNFSRTQITHTISRHLSLIISKDKNEFIANYQRIKKLYNYRSSIIHGSKIKENLSEITTELQNYVRKAINYCLTISENKKELFEKLNATGMEKL